MTVRDTITSAIGMTQARSLGDPPSAEEMAAGLTALQSMLLSLPRVVLTEVLITANYTAGEDERVTMSGGTYTVTKPATVTDAKTGIARAPRNGAVVEIANATTPERYIYVTELAGWQQVHGLALTSTQPFGPEHEQGLAAMLAVRMCEPVFQKPPTQTVIALAQEGRRSIRQRFRQLYTATTDPLLLNVFQRNGSTV